MPILKKLTDAFILWHEFLDHIPKKSRYTLGTRIDHLFLDALELILQAGYAPREQKLQILQRTNIKLDALKFFLRVAWQVKTLDHKQYAALSVPVDGVGNEIGGWQKYLLKNTPAKAGVPSR